MRRIRSHIQLVTALAIICLAGQLVGAGVAAAASSPTINKAALNKQVQEAIAKAQAEKGAGAQGATSAGSTGAGTGPAGSSGAFSNLTGGKAGEEEATTPTTARTATSPSSGISINVLVPIFVVGLLLLGGIAYFIVRDARGMAPAGDGLASASAAQDRAIRQRKRRAKAKAARRQRKRNR
jgi:cobalamin biosynthesis Mg chelatase CobN